MISEQQIEEFISRHRLPLAFRRLIHDHFAPLVSWLARQRRHDTSLLLGINGAQGTGKSTLADFVRFTLEANNSWRVAVLSLDDFYLTQVERRRLSIDVHPLLTTRGVPGTHDVPMLTDCLTRLRGLAQDESLSLPRFDKARDDRAAPDTWPVVCGPIDLIVLEGWCVGSRRQTEAELIEPVNELERDRDTSGAWRRFVNDQLAGPYADLFAKLDLLVFLQAPDFDAVYRWRLEQEEKLASQSTVGGTAIMDRRQVAEFIQYFERITRANLKSLPQIADAILRFDDNHDCVESSTTAGQSIA